MFHHRILVYSENQTPAATMQIRLVGPLGQQGFELVDAHQFQSVWNRPGFSLTSRFDAVVVHRGIRKRCPVYPRLISLAREQQIPVILDLDDLLFRVPRTHPDFAVYQSRTSQVLKVLLDADMVVASTQPLAEQLSAFHPSVVVIPNELPPALWSEVCRKSQIRSVPADDDQVTIGYIGTETHRPDLQMVDNVLLSVLRQYRNRVKFLSVGVPLSASLRREPNVIQIKPGKRIEFNYAEFVMFAASLPIEIGIAPLLNNPFNCCKSDVKFQEYAALGIAGVYSDLPTYRSSVQHGENGFLVTDSEQWRSSLEQLVTSPELRHRIALNSARHLQVKWQSSQAGNLWNQTIEMAKDQSIARLKGATNPIAAIVDEIIDYQSGLERQLKQSVRYQAGKLFSRFLRKWAA